MDVQDLRKRAKWSQLQLAAYLGCTQGTISRLENGQKVSGPIKRLLADLDVKLREDLIRGGSPRETIGRGKVA